MDIVFVTAKYLSLFEGILPLDVIARAKMKNQSQVLLGAVCENRVCGVLAAHVSGEILVLSHIYVLPEMRRRGIADKLLLELLNFADVNTEIKGIRCTFISDTQDFVDDSVARLLIGKGFSVEYTDDREYLINMQALTKNSFWQKAIESDKNSKSDIIPFSSLSPSDFRVFSKYITRTNAPAAPITFPGNALPEFSMAFYTDAKIMGVATVDAGVDDSFYLSWLYVKPNNSPMILSILLHKVFAKIYELRPDADVYVATTDETSQKLVERLCPGSNFRLLAEAYFDLADLRNDENVQAVLEYLLENVNVEKKEV